MSSYKEPEWGVAPSSSSSSSSHPPWTVTEIKNGIEVGRHDLSGRATTIFGRAVDMVHVPLHHESISRRHARIAFDAGGNAWLRDLRSAHGTFVNKRRLPAEASGKEESNSLHRGARGIRVFAGDVLRFGASSRYFSLEGGPPPASERSEEARLQEKADKWQQQQQQQQGGQTDRASVASSAATDAGADPKGSPSGDAGISWGISMEDDTEGGAAGTDAAARSKSNASLLEDPLKIPEKHRRELDKINALKYKLSNLETEDQRIRRKGVDNLTEGQERQLLKNAEKEAALRRSIQEREDSLCDKLRGSRSSDRTKARKTTDGGNEDEEDDFFDRTKTSSDAGPGNDGAGDEAESEETLTEKWRAAYRERNHLSTVALPNARARADRLKERVRALEAAGDDEEAFYVQNDLSLALEARKKAESSLARNATTMDGIESLLRVVNSRIRCDRETGHIGEGRPRPGTPPPESGAGGREPPREEQPLGSTVMQPPPPVLPNPTPTAANHEKRSMPPPPPSIQTGAQAATKGSGTESATPMAPPPNKKKRILGPAAGPPATKKERTVGTLAFLNRTTSAAKKSNSDAIRNAKDATKTAEGTTVAKPGNPQRQQLSMDTQVDVWRAPDGQDGSGRTKLNEKFAGRY